MSVLAPLHTPRRARVQIPQAVSALDYIVPDEISLARGDLVCVPLGKQRRIGVVIDFPEDQDSEHIRYKPLLAKLDHLPPLSPAHLEYLNWLADYYLSPRGQAYRLALPPREEFYQPAQAEITYTLTGTSPGSLSSKQQALYDEIARNDGTRTQAQLLQNSNTHPAQLKALCEKDLITQTSRTIPETSSFHLATLNPAQQNAFDTLKQDIENGSEQISLLDGTTGSGKTEIYFHLITAALARNKQVLVLLPEVSLLVDWQQRFHKRFGFKAPCWHNGITPKARRRLWQQAASGELPVLVGTRSALHQPFASLGLIVVDEEHAISYKQEDGIPYHARDMAVVRAKIQKIPLVLASATPALESLENTRRGKYRHIVLPTRFQDASPPCITLIDVREYPAPAENWLSPPLITALEETLKNQQQALLFLNRRGFAPLMLCRHCGYRFLCPQCSVALSEHRYPRPYLSCHHCGHRTHLPAQCPECGLGDRLASSGPGVERILDNLHKHFPNIRAFAATADSLDSPADIDAFLKAMQAGDIDVVVGTQIIAKGLDFPRLTLAGIIDADQALFGSNPRAAEHTWQLLHQIAGRTGRHTLPGRALLQTRNPDDLVFQSLKNMNRSVFHDYLRRIRQNAALPPFGRMLAMIVQSRDTQSAEHTAHALAAHCPKGSHRLLGPSTAPIARLRGWYRQRLLLLAPQGIPLQPIARTMIQQTEIPAKVRLKIDVDPYNFV